MPTRYPRDRSLVKGTRRTHDGLTDHAAFLRLLSWLEDQWAREEHALRSELASCDEGFADWLRALVQAWADADEHASTSPEAIQSLTGLSSLAALISELDPKPAHLMLQLLVAWMWARGSARGATERFLRAETRLTGYSGTQLQNLLNKAEPVRQALKQTTRQPQLWRFRASSTPIVLALPSPHMIDPDGAEIFIESEFFEQNDTLRVRLDVPAGVCLDRYLTLVALPRQHTHQGRAVLRFEYVLIHDAHVLDRQRSLEAQGVTAGALLDLGVAYATTAALRRPPVDGYHRGDDENTRRRERRLERKAQALLKRAAITAGLRSPGT